MGAVDFSLSASLVDSLRAVLPLKVFVETGTFEGDTIERVLSHFDSIYSVELSDSYYRMVAERFKTSAKVHLYHGHSAEVLRMLQPELAPASVLYWLDAHWCVADKTAGGASQCPLLQELDAIGKVGSTSVILIDDARLFFCPPPYPHEVEHWPTLDEVVGRLKAASTEHELMIVNDVIMFFPGSVRKTVREYAYRNSIDWLQVLFKSKNYDEVRKEFDKLQVQFDSLQNQLVEKDAEIDRLVLVSEERARSLKEKEAMITDLHAVAEERARHLTEKEKVIHLINDELETIKRHWAYRLAAKLKRLFRG